jgi:PIN domain nuclease of toxin-antitoxin system
MKYLLDTHVFLWYFEDSDKLSETAANIIENTKAEKYVSIASLWEFSIKYSMNKLEFEGGLSQLWKMISQNGFIILPITQFHLERIVSLPFYHRDPFDRLIIATAQAENTFLVTADENIHKYDVKYVWK